MTGRRKRGERRTGRHHLQPRDVALLCELARMRVATSAQLAVLFFGTLSACHRRLRALASLGLLRVAVVGMNERNLITLTAAGEAVVVDAGVPVEEIHRSRHLYFRDRHAELIVDLRVGFLRWSRATPGTDIEAFLSDWDLRRAVGRAAKNAHVPDAVVSVRADGQTIVLAFEIDRGGESLGEVRKKAVATRALFDNGERLFGYAGWRPVLLAPTARRLLACARVIVGAGAGELWAIGLISPCVSDPAGASFGLAGDFAATGDASRLVRTVLPRPVPRRALVWHRACDGG